MSETEAAARYEVGIQPTRVIDGHQIIAVWPEGTKADMEHAQLVADALNRTAILGSQAELVAQLTEVLADYERWEADLILNETAWGGADATIPQDLWDRLIEIQGKRNRALAAADAQKSGDAKVTE